MFTSEGKRQLEISRWIGAASASMQSAYWTVMVKREISHKAELLIYWSVYAPTPTSGQKIWIMTWEELGLKPPLLGVERTQKRWLGHWFRMPLGHLLLRRIQECPSRRRP